MRPIPMGSQLLVRLRNYDPNRVRTDGTILSVQDVPYGYVLLTGPECTEIEPGENVLFNPANFIGFDPVEQTGFVLESSCFGKLAPEEPQPSEDTLGEQRES